MMVRIMSMTFPLYSSAATVHNAVDLLQILEAQNPSSRLTFTEKD